MMVVVMLLVVLSERRDPAMVIPLPGVTVEGRFVIWLPSPLKKSAVMVPLILLLVFTEMTGLVAVPETTMPLPAVMLLTFPGKDCVGAKVMVQSLAMDRLPILTKLPLSEISEFVSVKVVLIFST